MSDAPGIMHIANTRGGTPICIMPILDMAKTGDTSAIISVNVEDIKRAGVSYWEDVKDRYFEFRLPTCKLEFFGSIEQLVMPDDDGMATLALEFRGDCYYSKRKWFLLVGDALREYKETGRSPVQ